MKNSHRNIMVAIAIFIVLGVVFIMLYKKRRLKQFEETVDSFDGIRVKKNTPLYLKKREYLQELKFVDNDPAPYLNGTKNINTTTPLYYVGRYDSRYQDNIIVRRSGWFFDRYYLVNTNKLA